MKTPEKERCSDAEKSAFLSALKTLRGRYERLEPGERAFVDAIAEKLLRGLCASRTDANEFVVDESPRSPNVNFSVENVGAPGASFVTNVETNAVKNETNE